MNLLHKVFLLLALVALAFGQENEVSLDDNSRSQPRTIVHEVNLNEAFDKSLPNIRSYIIKHGFDPMGIPDIEIPLSHLPGLMRAKMIMHHGILQELSTIYRTGDIILQYSMERVSLYLNIGWETLDLSHQYTLRYMLYHRKGDCYGRYHNVEAKMLVDFDLATNKIDLKFFKFVGVKDFKLKLEGNLTDALLNILTSVVTKVFREQVLTMIEMTTYAEIDKAIQEINEMIPEPEYIKVVSKFATDIAPYRLDGLGVAGAA